MQVVIALAAAFLATVLAGSTTATAAVSGRPVDLLWSPDDQDIYPNQPVIVDEFSSTGPPFGPQAVETRTPRDQMFENTKRGKWVLYLKKRDLTQEPGVCKGTFEITKNYVETTATTQTVTYDGELRLVECRRTRKFAQARPARWQVSGRSFCTVGSCSGGLKITGRLRY